MKTEEIRHRLSIELNEQYTESNNKSDLSTVYDTSTVGYGKPQMFMPQSDEKLENTKDITRSTVKGIGFVNTQEEVSALKSDDMEIYNMQEFISSSPANMKTFSYEPETTQTTQYALVKKRTWQDILFGDVDLFKKIDLTAGLKKLFKKF